MKLVLIGHRGVGKSSLAARIKIYLPDLRIADLDLEIERATGLSAFEIFERNGESAFREFERTHFKNLTNHFDVIVAGAGFEPTEKLGFQFLWVRRPTDRTGRVFTDRPRLEPHLPPLQEYAKRFEAREERYAQLADKVLVLDEGFDFPNSAEKTFFTSSIQNLGGVFTVFTHHICQLEEMLKWGVGQFELRDDILSYDDIEEVLDKVSPEKVLFSFRNSRRIELGQSLVEKHSLSFDWPLEFGPCAWAEPKFVSWHVDEANLDMKRLPQNQNLKLAVKVSNFRTLMHCHEWQQEDPLRRSFLPMSKNGIWKWYRLFHRQPLEFFRIDEGSAPDQPTLLERVRQNEFDSPKRFAAVLGSPVEHSRSPGEHFDFFKKQNQPFYAIDLNEEQFSEGIEALTRLGLFFAAVTSPLKTGAAKLVGADNPVNTLIRRDDRWIGHNTDTFGLEALKTYGGPKDTIAVWGGGGTVPSIREVFPNAHFFSSRSGQPKFLQDRVAPNIILWAVGRKHFDFEGVYPPLTWKIQKVIDLNYAENSPGRECALKFGCEYISGLEMFRAQAAAQRSLFERSFGPPGSTKI